MDIKEFLNQGNYERLSRLNTEKALNAEKVRHDSFESYEKAYADAISNGHRVTPRDNPMTLSIGFLDIEDLGKKDVCGLEVPMFKTTWHLLFLSHLKDSGIVIDRKEDVVSAPYGPQILPELHGFSRCSFPLSRRIPYRGPLPLDGYS